MADCMCTDRRAPNLTPGTSYWFDLGLAAIGGAATIKNLSLTATKM